MYLPTIQYTLLKASPYNLGTIYKSKILFPTNPAYNKINRKTPFRNWGRAWLADRPPDQLRGVPTYKGC